MQLSTAESRVNQPLLPRQCLANQNGTVSLGKVLALLEVGGCEHRI